MRSIDANIVFYLFPCILSLMLIRTLFKKKFQTRKALNVIRWFIMVYSIVILAHFIIRVLIFSEQYSFLERATGRYWWAYWLMFVGSTILPYTLLIKKLASNYVYVLFIAVFMKIGFYFERFVIVATSLHRDYAPNGGFLNWLGLIIFGILITFIWGFILAVLLLGLVEITDWCKARYQNGLNTNS